jgi:hypothetical protein
MFLYFKMLISILCLLFNYISGNTIYVDNTSNSMGYYCGTTTNPCKDVNSGFGRLSNSPAELIIVNRGDITDGLVSNFNCIF